MIIETVWGTKNRRIITSIAGMIAAICAVVSGVPPAWTALGLPEVASKVFVEQQLQPVRAAQSNVESSVRRTDLDLAKMHVGFIDDQIVRWNIELQKAADDAARQMIQSQIANLQNQKEEVTGHIAKLTSP